MAIPITALYGSILALIFVGLSSNVSYVRGKAKVATETTPLPPEVHRAVRAHGNFSEYVPFGLVMLATAELAGGSSMVLHVFGGVLLVARISHMVGLLGKVGPGVTIGATLTYVSLAAEAVYNLILRFR